MPVARSTAAGLLLVYIYFFSLAWDGVRSYFLPDDMMNLYLYWKEPAGKLLRDGFLFWNGAYRPAGAAFYLPLFAVFGFNPLPFRIACFVLLALNLFLAFAVVRELTGRGSAALAAALLFAYHAHFADLYYSSGTIYDLLCFTFFYGCLLLYVRGTARWCPALLVLFVLALESKEIAVVLPAVLLAYEALYRRQVRRTACIAAAVAVAAAFMGARLFGSGSMASTEGYRLHVSLWFYLDNLRHYLRLLLFWPSMPAAAAVAVGVASAVLAVALRRRDLLFAWCLFALGSLPVMFLTARGPFVLYLPYLGLAMYLAALLAPLWRRPVALIALAAALYALNTAHKPRATAWVAADEAKVRQIAEGAGRRWRHLPRGARVLVIDSPFGQDDWQPLFILRLYYRDDTLQVRWLASEALTPASRDGAEYVLRCGEESHNR